MTVANATVWTEKRKSCCMRRSLYDTAAETYILVSSTDADTLISSVLCTAYNRVIFYSTKSDLYTIK